MAGHLQKHPYYRSWDELQRTEKRMRTYLDMNFSILPDDEKESINILLEAVEKAKRFIPDEYQVTRHFQNRM